MRKFLVILSVVASFTGSAFAGHGATDFVATGTIAVGSPTTALDTTAYELGPCGFPRNHPNVESAWITLPEGSEGHDFTLTGTDAAGLADVDVYFVDGSCGFLDYTNHSLVLGEDPDEAGTVPAGSVYAEIDLFSGVQAQFTLTVKSVLP